MKNEVWAEPRAVLARFRCFIVAGGNVYGNEGGDAATGLRNVKIGAHEEQRRDEPDVEYAKRLESWLRVTCPEREQM